jgi:beta-lactamase superfamily II metal-dependent hydrolase
LALPVVIWGWNYCWHLPAPRLTILPVHGGTSIYYDAFGTENDLLIDVGSTNSVNFITKPFLRAQGVNRSPPLVLSHGDIHHMGGVEPFRQAFDIPRIYTSPVPFRSAPYRRILARLAKVPGLVNPTGRGQIVGNWKILHPDLADRYSRADDGAVVLKGMVRETSILLLSDLGRAGQADLLQRAEELRAEIVVTGLPAADEPLSEELLRAIQPRLIIISDSELPISERASPKLQERLNRTGRAVVYTRRAGAVTLDFERGSWRLHTTKGLLLNSTDANLSSAAKQFQAPSDSPLTQPNRDSNAPESPADIQSPKPGDTDEG